MMGHTNHDIRFLGAAGTVTGSRHLIDLGDRRVLLDCGMFQGLKELRLRNREEFPFDPHTLDAVVVSHAHIDHTGLLPVLAREGYRGPIFCTPATASLMQIMLRDAAYLQEEQASHANKFGYSKHKPAVPLYTMEDAEATLDLLRERVHHDRFEPVPGVQVTFRPTGHILGSASIDLSIDGGKRVVYSGDLGRWDRPILKDPVAVPEADVLLVESTYGNRDHALDPEEQLAGIINRTVDRGGTLLVPAFAVGRTQELIWRIRQLEDQDLIPRVPVYVDSPMAVDVTRIYRRHSEEHDPETRRLIEEGRFPLRTTHFTLVRTTDASKALNEVRGPIIIISASGMVTGGRILHHLKTRVGDKRNTVMLVGYQAAGTRGQLLENGADSMRIHGADVAVRAKVEVVHGLSAHADRGEIERWCRGFRRPPKKVYLVHGEPKASVPLAASLREIFGWDTRVVEHGETAEI